MTAANLIGSFGNLGADNHCAVGAPSCATNLTETLSLTNISGTSTLYFVVEQAGNQAPGQDPSGLDWSGRLNPTPEPSSLIMLGSGLVGAASMALRRRKTA